jgi:hypothetical protein
MLKPMTLLGSLADAASDLCPDEQSVYARWRSIKTIGDDFVYAHLGPA